MTELSEIATYEAAAAYLCALPRFIPKVTPEEVRELLDLVGAPDLKLPHIIHVAGTNGKGSVCTYLSSMLTAAGYSTAVFTSPHLNDMRERIVIRGEMVSREDFLRAFHLVRERIDREVKFFEYIFLMAMILFAEAQPDYCILETGLGGRLDATNAVRRKDLTVITRIGRDHMAILGDTLDKIAGEKAGILMPGVPLAYCGDVPEATAVIAGKARSLGIESRAVSESDVAFPEFHKKTIDFSIRTEYHNTVRVTLRTIAHYQTGNAALAVRALELLEIGRAFPEEAIRCGLEQAHWPGRMEEIASEIYVDGAHNEDGIRAFLESVASDGCTGGRTLLFGVVTDKDQEPMVRQIVQSGLFDRYAVTRLETARSADPYDVARLFCRLEVQPEVYGDVQAAMESILEQRSAGERVYAAGSLYLVGEIRRIRL